MRLQNIVNNSILAHTYIHTYIHAYIHTYIHTYPDMFCVLVLKTGEASLDNFYTSLDHFCTSSDHFYTSLDHFYTSSGRPPAGRLTKKCAAKLDHGRAAAGELTNLGPR